MKKAPTLSQQRANRALLGAARILRRDGWCTGSYTNARGQHCIRGALGQVTKTTSSSTDEIIEMAFRAATGSDIVAWNDLSCPDQEAAILAVESAARIALLPSLAEDNPWIRP